MNRIAHHWIAWPAALGLLLGALGCGGGDGATHATPQAAFDGAKKAAKQKDYVALLGSMTKESQDIVAGSLAMMGMMMKAFGGLAALGGEKAKAEFEKKTKALDDVLTRHGVKAADLQAMGGMMKNPTLEQAKEAFARITAPIQDRAGFVGDMMAALDAMGDKTPGGGKKPTEFFEGRLVDVKIEGDQATGTVVATRSGKEERTPLGFKRVGGGWLIDATASLLKKSR